MSGVERVLGVERLGEVDWLGERSQERPLVSSLFVPFKRLAVSPLSGCYVVLPVFLSVSTPCPLSYDQARDAVHTGRNEGRLAEKGGNIYDSWYLIHGSYHVASDSGTLYCYLLSGRYSMRDTTFCGWLLLYRRYNDTVLLLP
jgi:hypothetical protein